jgi:hypothetical protein
MVGMDPRTGRLAWGWGWWLLACLALAGGFYVCHRLIWQSQGRSRVITRENYQQIRVGMRQPEVRALLGKPDSIWINGGREQYFGCRWTTEDHDIVVCFSLADDTLLRRWFDGEDEGK